MKCKALILGITGTLGGALAEDLLEYGWEVHGVARFSGRTQPEDFEDRGIPATRFDVTDDDPAVLPDADVVFLEIWDPGRP
jgi:nucleoside-diphosphate-sugar epimerase